MAEKIILRRRGTIQQKADRIERVYDKIQRQHARGIRESTMLDRLRQEFLDLEFDISQHMVQQDQRVEDPLHDYCLRNLDIMGGEYKAENSLSRREYVEEFMENVNEYQGQAIMTQDHNTPIEKGIISGKALFKIDDTFRYLLVPVENLKEFNSEKSNWKSDEKSETITIPSSIFEQQMNLLPETDGITWQSYPERKGPYIGGPGPQKQYVFLGDSKVKSHSNMAKEIDHSVRLRRRC